MLGESIGKIFGSSLRKMPMSMCRRKIIKTYLKDSMCLMKKGRKDLAKGDVRHASEKGWGAAALILKAVGESRGWRHSSDRNLCTIARNLSKETGDEEIVCLFFAARTLHQKLMFSENWTDKENVAYNLDEVSLLLKKLAPVVRPPAKRQMTNATFRDAIYAMSVR